MLEELRALVEAEQLRMSAIPKVFELHEIDDALAVRSVARLRFNFWLTGCVMETVCCLGAGFGDVADGGQDCDPMCRGARSAVRGGIQRQRDSLVGDDITTYKPSGRRHHRQRLGRGIQASAECSSVP